VQANVHIANAVGRTPLHIAATVGRSDMGAHLLRMKAVPGVMDSLGWTPRQTAEFHNHSDFCELMIRSEMVDKQYSMKDVPPGKWDTPLWKEVTLSYHEKKKQLDKESHRFEKKITRMSSMGSMLSRQNSMESYAEEDDSLSTTTRGNESTVSDSFDTLSRKKKASEGLSSFAMAAKRNVGFK
jgi:ankyrin repeat protein